jgi:hypothetical protein
VLPLLISYLKRLSRAPTQKGVLQTVLAQQESGPAGEGSVPPGPPSPERLRQEIADKVLTLRCPRHGCRQAFVDFDGGCRSSHAPIGGGAAFVCRTRSSPVLQYVPSLPWLFGKSASCPPPELIVLVFLVEFVRQLALRSSVATADVGSALGAWRTAGVTRTTTADRCGLLIRY